MKTEDHRKLVMVRKCLYIQNEEIISAIDIGIFNLRDSKSKMKKSKKKIETLFVNY